MFLLTIIYVFSNNSIYVMCKILYIRIRMSLKKTFSVEAITLRITRNYFYYFYYYYYFRKPVLTGFQKLGSVKTGFQKLGSVKTGFQKLGSVKTGFQNTD